MKKLLLYLLAAIPVVFCSCHTHKYAHVDSQNPNLGYIIKYPTNAKATRFYTFSQLLNDVGPNTQERILQALDSLYNRDVINLEIQPDSIKSTATRITFFRIDDEFLGTLNSEQEIYVITRRLYRYCCKDTNHEVRHTGLTREEMEKQRLKYHCTKIGFCP